MPLLSSAEESLIISAKRAGLKAIPTDEKELKKLIDPKNVITPARVALGKQLFYDTRLSEDNTINCAFCHNLATGGADGLSAAIGIKGQVNPHHLNSPTVYNSALFSAQFWDGRSPDVEDQAQGPMQAPFEMGMTPALAEKRINAVPEYVKAFKEAYGKKVKITFSKIADAIGAFERTLVTPSRFDDYLNGKEDALNAQEKKGLRTFIDRGCTNCHTDVAMGGTMQPFAIADKFKYEHIGDFKGDANGLVKVPSLRNVTLNSPYFHNGSVDELKDAIKEMSRIQLSITEIEEYEIDDLIAFFKALEGRKPDITLPNIPK
jgi:cytochrome c peroxidase